MSVMRTKFDLHPLYGIVATQKSYLIGIRCLISTYHARMLASRIVPPDFPDELVSAVTDNLVGLAELQVRTVCDASADWDDRLRKFGISQMLAQGGRSPAERAAMGQLKTLDVAVIPIAISRTEARPTHWVHLSAAGVRPQLYDNNPGVRRPATSGMTRHVNNPSMLGMGIALRAYCVRNTGMRFQRDYLDFDAQKLATDHVVLDRPLPSSTRLERLVELDGLDEAQRAWRQADVAKFVKSLKLHVVATAGKAGDGMLPKLRLLNVMETS